MRRQRLAIIGFGKLGRVCARAVLADDQLELAGIVRRSPAAPLPTPFADTPVVAHISELAQVDVALICVPTDQVVGVAHDLLQRRIPIIECATLHGDTSEAHFQEIDRIARHHKAAAVVGAGWDPGALSLLRGLFALLVPKGHHETSWRPGVELHHSTLAGSIVGVRQALVTELPAASGRTMRYVYVEREDGADLARVEQAIRADPLYLGEETLVIPVESVAALEDDGKGVLMQRRGVAAGTAHQSLLLEARYSETALTAVIMVAAARALPSCEARAYSLFELPLGSLWGAMHESARKEWM